MISPTGLGIRNDTGGQGHWGASRKRNEKKYKHEGTDFEARFAQNVVAPFNFLVKRISKPNNSYLSGIAFESESCTGKMWYFSPLGKVIGTNVKQGDVIGTAQSLQAYYGNKVTDHVHFQIDSIDPMFIIQISEMLMKFGYKK